jgi:oxygen-independent coproporphyrinogen-3 oxidase
MLKQLDEAEHRGLIERDHLRIKPTPLGQRFLNDLLQIFLPQSSPQTDRVAGIPSVR